VAESTPGGWTEPRSLWLDPPPRAARPRLDEDRRFDVAVLGGGITGLTAALLLSRAGRSTGLLESRTIASGTSGHTTAKVTSQHGVAYADLRGSHGADAARLYAESNEAAKERIAGFVAEGIECDFRPRSAYLYAETAPERRKLEREAEAAREAGLPVELIDSTPLPYDVAGALRCPDQGEMHPGRYLAGLADMLEQSGGEIFESTAALSVKQGEPCRIRTERCTVQAHHVVVATLLPFLDRGGFFARAFPSRSYAVAASIEEAPPEGMFINIGSPTRSIRSQPSADGELLLVGGEGHHVGTAEAQPERYEKLIEFAHRNWTVNAVINRWSAQDYTTDDGVPYVGLLYPLSERIHAATGFGKWGLTGGTAAAMIIADAIAGEENPWHSLYSTRRVKPIAGGPRILLENTRAGLSFVTDRIAERGRRPINELARGEGGIVSAGGQKVAAFRGDDGRLHAVSTRCTHLGCQVRWNAAERTWDCPCHGSRFSVEGEVLNAPAVHPLPPRPVL
jgi:glycine/D-amino acid oxidase-like deaminating enzyme/nitrite reductase/ring-hydroxylating ferredoxin subunit